jgi:hypothetical protein
MTRSLRLFSLLAFTVAAPALAEKTDAQILKEFGADLLKNAPAAVQSGSPIEKAKYGFAKYCDMLAKNEVGVNSNLWTRLQNLARNQDASKWTCGDHATNLEAVFNGMGIKEPMGMISADADSSLPTPNADHGSLGISYQGKFYFFDAWQLAVNNGGKYSGAATSKWNGMDSKAWEAEMKKQGYVRFADDGTNFRAGIDPAISKYVKAQPGDLKNPPKDLSGVSKEQLQAHIDALKAQHKVLQEELVALPPGADAAGNQIRSEQKSLYNEVMRLKKELAKR